MSSPVPHFVSVPGGQLRVWVMGEGVPLVVLPGLILGPIHRAMEAAEYFPERLILSVELPGLGASALQGDFGISQTSDALSYWFGLFDTPVDILSHDLALLVTRKLLETRETLNVNRVAVADMSWQRNPAIRRRRLSDLALADDGTHLLKLWAHLRNQDMLCSDDERRARVGAPYVSAEALDEALLCFGVNPLAYSRYWNAAAASCDPLEVLPPDVLGCNALGDASGYLSREKAKVLIELPGNEQTGSDMTRQYVQIARGRVHLRRAGQGKRLLLAFLAGAGSSANLAPLLDGLREAFLVVAPDYIGQGDSCRNTTPIDTAQLARDAHDIASALGFSKYDVYGTHTGAGVALEVCLAFPNSVGKIIIDGISMKDPSERTEHRAKYFPHLEPDLWGSHVHKAWNVRRDGGYFWPWYRPDPASVRTGRAPTLPLLHDRVICTLRSRTTPAYQAAASYQASTRLPLLRQPCLFVAGPHDTFADDFDKARAIAGPNVQFKRVPATVWFAGQEATAVVDTLRIFAEFLSPSITTSSVQ